MGIWLIKYGLQKQAETEYLDWFHDIHIAEKLARPGYTWAAHYRISDNNSGAPEFIALFGGVLSVVIVVARLIARWFPRLSLMFPPMARLAATEKLIAPYGVAIAAGTVFVFPESALFQAIVGS